MDSHYEADTLRVFGRFVDAGLVEWKLKTVPWCASCHTTLSKSEMEYTTRSDPSCYVSFPLDGESFSRLATLLPGLDLGVQVSLVAWTTTPWTLPFNRAVVLSPRGRYALVRFKDSKSLAVVGEAEYASLKRLLKLEGILLLAPFLTSEDTAVAVLPSTSFKGMFALHPLLEGVVPVLLDDMVDLGEKATESQTESAGEADGKAKMAEKSLPTGVVHLAPSCGPEDYKVGQANGLKTEEALTPDGRYTEGRSLFSRPFLTLRRATFFLTWGKGD